MISPVLFQSRSVGISRKRKREFPTKLETELRRFSFSFCANSRLSKTKRPTGVVDKRYSVIGRLKYYADVLQANSKSSRALHNYYRNNNICITQLSLLASIKYILFLKEMELSQLCIVINHNNYIVTEKCAFEVAINVCIHICIVFCLSMLAYLHTNCVQSSLRED